MESIPYAQIEKGTFLISTPDIEMGFFFRAVILICEHNSNGSFGLVVNKPLDLELPKEILSMGELTNSNVSIRAAGPLQTNQMMLLHDSASIPHQTLKICDGSYLGGDLQFLQEALAEENGPNIFLCFGYAGWGAGQLEREFLDGNWFVWPASQQYIFNTPSDKLWASLLRAMGGRYAALSMIPDDLTLN